MQGNADLVQVMPLLGDSSVSFVEPLETGAVQSTTILSDGSAVHSLHSVIIDEFIASQWHGTCKRFGGRN